MKNKNLIMAFAILIIALSSTAQQTDTFTDSRDGKTYKTVQIYLHIWMAENLAFKTDSGCLAYDVTKYGYLYNWKTAKKVCPSGWHLPSDAEWTALTNSLSGEPYAGKHIKSTKGWKRFGNGKNYSGFGGLPGGQHYYDLHNISTFEHIGKSGIWWSSTENEDGGMAVARCAYYRNDYLIRENFSKSHGLSVRCVMDSK